MTSEYHAMYGVITMCVRSQQVGPWRLLPHVVEAGPDVGGRRCSASRSTSGRAGGVDEHAPGRIRSSRRAIDDAGGPLAQREVQRDRVGPLEQRVELRLAAFLERVVVAHLHAQRSRALGHRLADVAVADHGEPRAAKSGARAHAVER